MPDAFDLLALGLERKSLALSIARMAVAGEKIPGDVAEKFSEIDTLFRNEQDRLTALANKPRPRSRY